MTTKTDYTPEEWAQLRSAPAAAGMYITAADPRGFDTVREMFATANALANHSPEGAAQELVSSLVTDLKESRAAQKEAAGSESETPDIPTGEPQVGKEALMERIREAAAVVDAKADPAEAAAYKAWLVDIAQIAAEAAKEGGFLGFGGQQVTDKERAALDELKAVLNI